MVFWDEPAEEIFHTLEVNGFTGKQADEIYQDARRERIADIRSDAAKKAAIGVASIAGAIVLIAIGADEGMRRGQFVGSFAAFIFGLWKLVDGSYTFITAPKKRGSLADHDD